MENKETTIMNNETPAAVVEKKEELLKPGARVIPILLILFAAVFFIESLTIYQKDPSLSGSATFPLLVSGIMLVLCISDLIEKLVKKTEVSGLPFKERAVAFIRYLMPLRCFVFLLMSVGYYILLRLGLGFIISSLIYLIASMCYLMRGSIKKNILYSVICVAALYLIFKVIFKVFLP